MNIQENIVFGLDTGIASLGWSIWNKGDDGAGIQAGAWLFDAPETDKERKLTNQIRRENRLLRRVIRRKAKRMGRIRSLLQDHDLTDTADKGIFKALLLRLNQEAGQGINAANEPQEGITPWRLRAEALDRKLSGPELAVVLGHIAKHAGFKSNRKGGEKSSVGEDQKALKSMGELEKDIKDYRSFGEALFKEQKLRDRKRNRDGIYDRTPKRAWLDKETGTIFDRQREMGNALATTELEQAYKEKAFTRCSLQDSKNLLGNCSFEEDEKRASKHAPSFERFRLLQALVNMRLDWPSQLRSDLLASQQLEQVEAHAQCALTPEQIAMTLLERRKKLTFAKVRQLLDLPDGVSFQGMDSNPKKRKKQESYDITRTKNGAEGTVALNKVLGNLYTQCTAEQLDETMARIAFLETADSIRKGLKNLDLPAGAIEQLMCAVDKNAFNFATGAANLSAKACRNIIPHLRKGMTYDKACEVAGYDHAAPTHSPFVKLRHDFKDSASITERRKAIIEILVDPKKSPVNSPVARKAAIELVKQFAALCHEQLDGDLPGKVHIELARDVGKSGDERGKIKRGLDNRTAERKRSADYIQKEFGIEKPSGDDIRRYELAKEQGYKCLYTGESIDPNLLFDGQIYQIDHILPWSRFGDNSFHNLSLCTATANQQKKDRTPFEWFSEQESEDWGAFVARVEASPGGQKNKKGEDAGLKGLKKRNYLLKNAKEREEAFRNRNLNDTRWAARIALQAIEAFYPIERNEHDNLIRRIRARPGEVTSLLRRGWGLERFKKDENGKRIPDDRHHALDAIITAATSERALQDLTKACQKAERQGLPRPFAEILAPWSGFRQEVENTFAGIRVARPERRRARGEGHEATIRGLDPETGTVFVRKTPEKIVSGLEKKAAGNWKELYGLIAEQFEYPERSKPIIKALTCWALKGADKDNPPKGPTGDAIRKVRVIDKGKKPAVLLPEKFYAEQGSKPRHATADRGEIARVDVFESVNQKGKNKGKKQYWLVPIYSYQVMDKSGWPEPPNRAIAANKPEDKWPEMGPEHKFLFSLYSHSWIEIVKTDGEVIAGYYKGTDRNTGAITIGEHNNLNDDNGIGARNLRSFRKFAIDRLGRKFEILSEKRTWHGKVCISANLPD